MNELQHYGVKGMKWGVRKKRYNDSISTTKAAYKSAKKDYSKSFNRANNRSLAAFSPNKKHRQANDRRWEDAVNKAEVLNKAKKDYKNAKKEFKSDVKKVRKATGVYDIDYNERGEATSVRNRRMETLASIQKEKGRDYVNRILDHEKKGQRTALAAVAGTYAVAFGAAVVGSMLDY